MSGVYRVTPIRGVPVLRHFASAARATLRAALEFPEGVSSVERVSVEAMGALHEGGFVLSPVARRVTAMHLEAQRKRLKRSAKVRAAAARRAKKREEEREARREARRLKTEAAKKARAAAKSAATRARKKAEKAAAETAPAPQVVPVNAPPVACTAPDDDLDGSPLDWDSDSDGAPW